MFAYLPFILPLFSISIHANPAASTYSCRFHITVTDAGTSALNGIYYDETSELSDEVVYYYKWSSELNDWILLFRATNDANSLKYWVFMTVAQLSASDGAQYRDYYIVQDDSAWPPSSGWTGSDVESTYSLGAFPNPTVTKTGSGWIWDEALNDCVRECTASVPTPPFECGILNVVGAIDTIQVNGNYSFLPSELSDCVPSYVQFSGEGATDDAGVTTWSQENTLLIYRYFYFGKTWWIMQNTKQLGADTFVENYSVESDVNAVTPPSTGWKKTVGLDATTATTVKPILLTLWDYCTPEQSTDALELKDSLDLPIATAAKPSSNGNNGNSNGGGSGSGNPGPIPSTPSTNPNSINLATKPKTSSAVTLVLNPIWRMMLLLLMTCSFFVVSS
jgi:hypothetical protein